jgi:hypothetical protein
MVYSESVYREYPEDEHGAKASCVRDQELTFASPRLHLPVLDTRSGKKQETLPRETSA